MDYGKFGLIFVRRNDPIGRLTTAITKQKHSIVGFYFETDVCGCVEHKVVWRDLTGLYNYYSPILFHNIEDIVNDPLVTSVVIKKLKPMLTETNEIDEALTSRRENSLRLAIAINDSKNETSYIEWIKRLFGFKIQISTESSTYIEFINSIMTEAELIQYIKFNNSLNPRQMKHLEENKEICNDAEGRNQIFEVLGSNFSESDINTDEHRLQSYFYDTEVFGENIEVPLPEHEEVSIKAESIKALEIYKHIITKLIYIFVELITSDELFSKCVISGINRLRTTLTEGGKKLYNPFIINMPCNNGETFTAYKSEDSNEYVATLKIVEVFENVLLYGYIEDDNHCNMDRVVVYPKDGSFEAAFNGMYSQLLKASNDINDCKDSNLNISCLIREFNVFIKATKSNLCEIPDIGKSKNLQFA